MSCLITIFLALVSRIAILLWWLTDSQRFNLAFKNWPAIPAVIWTLLGGIFLPWTTLAYVFVFPGGIAGYEWIVLGVAILIDLAGHGGGYRHRHRIRRYRRR